MHASKPLPVILHVRVPSILEGRDHRRYLERKLRGYHLRLRPPPTLIGTDIPVGYGLVRPAMGGWCLVEARGEVDGRATILDLFQHELVEDVLDEAPEDARRSQLAAERAALPHAEDGEPEDGFASGGPMPGPLTMAALAAAACALMPLAWIARRTREVRRWYLREHG